jgi:hypothetical protein
MEKTTHAAGGREVGTLYEKKPQWRLYCQNAENL